MGSGFSLSGGQRGYQQPPSGGYPAGPSKGRAPSGQPPAQQQPPYGGGFGGYQQPQYGGGYPAPPPPTQTETHRQELQNMFSEPPRQFTEQVPGRPSESRRLTQPSSYGSPGKGMRPQPYGGGFGGGFGGYQPSPYQVGPGALGKGQRRSPFPQSPYGGGFGGYQPSPYGGGFGGYQPSPYGGGFGGGFGGGYGGYQQSPYGGGFQGRSMGIGSLLRPNMQGLERQRIQSMMGINPYMR
jgi:hypothetical protein